MHVDKLPSRIKAEVNLPSVRTINYVNMHFTYLAGRGNAFVHQISILSKSYSQT